MAAVITDIGGTFEAFLPAADDRSFSKLWFKVVPGKPPLVELCPQLAQELDGFEETMHSYLDAFAEKPETFIKHLNDLLYKSRRERGAVQTRSAASYAALYAEFSKVTMCWDSIHHISDDQLSEITVALIDGAARNHLITVHIPSDYPVSMPSITAADIPTEVPPRPTLQDTLDALKKQLEYLQPVWESLDDLDHHVNVIEPAEVAQLKAPPRRCLYRRIALDNHVTLSITLDAKNPRAFPDFQFMGSEQSVEPLRSQLYTYFNSWKSDALLRHNLEDALGMTLPTRRDVLLMGKQPIAEELSAECFICYEYRRQGGGGDVPNMNCQNPSCGKPFHQQCLAEWLMADTSTRQAFGQLFGACPYCAAPIVAHATMTPEFGGRHP